MNGRNRFGSEGLQAISGVIRYVHSVESVRMRACDLTAHDMTDLASNIAHSNIKHLGANTHIHLHIYMHAYIHTYILTYIHTHIHTYLRVYIETCHTWIDRYPCIQTDMYTYKCIHAYIHCISTSDSSD